MHIGPPPGNTERRTLKGGEPVPDIKCTVTECEYNKNVKCDAPMIQVDRNHAASAMNSDHTKCETFKKK